MHYQQQSNFGTFVDSGAVPKSFVEEIIAIEDSDSDEDSDWDGRR